MEKIYPFSDVIQVDGQFSNVSFHITENRLYRPNLFGECRLGSHSRKDHGQNHQKYWQSFYDKHHVPFSFLEQCVPLCMPDNLISSLSESPYRMATRSMYTPQRHPVG